MCKRLFHNMIMRYNLLTLTVMSHQPDIRQLANSCESITFITDV